MLRKWMLVALFGFAFAGVATTHAQSTSHTFVLVHGAFQDASGWSAIVAELEAQGHTAVTVDLAGRADDATPIGEISLATYTAAVVAAIEAQAQPVILVAHSFGGIVASSAAEAVPDRIAAVVYLAAYLPQNGESLVTLSTQDHFSVLGQEGNFILAEDFTTASVNAEVFASAFCPDCAEDQLAAVAASQLAEPLAPLNEPVTLTPENFGSVRKAYILTAEDIVVSPQLQALMLAYTPVDQVFALNTGHSPYVTAPEQVAALLVQIAG